MTITVRHVGSICIVMLIAVLTACEKTGKSSTELYISRPATQSIIRLDTSDGRIVKETFVGMLPHNLQLGHDKSKLYVVLAGYQAIAELDVKSGDLLRTFLTEPVPRIRADYSVIKGHVRPVRSTTRRGLTARLQSRAIQ